MWCCGCLPAFHPRNKFHLRLFTVRHQWLQMLISDGEVGSLQISDSSSSFCFLLHLDVIWQKHHTVTANSCQLESCSATRGSLQTLIGEADTDSSNRFNRRGNYLFYFSEWNGGGGSHSTFFSSDFYFIFSPAVHILPGRVPNHQPISKVWASTFCTSEVELSYKRDLFYPAHALCGLLR